MKKLKNKYCDFRNVYIFAVTLDSDSQFFQLGILPREYRIFVLDLDTRYVQVCTQQQKLRKFGEITEFAKITKFKG